MRNMRPMLMLFDAAPLSISSGYTTTRVLRFKKLKRNAKQFYSSLPEPMLLSDEFILMDLESAFNPHLTVITRRLTG